MSCPMFDTCENYQENCFICSEVDEPCEDFECSCTRVKFLGSNHYGNYGKCPVCGEEGEL